MKKPPNAALRGLLDQPGHYGYGDGLYFRVLVHRKAYWDYRYQGVNGRRREMSFGLDSPVRARSAPNCAPVWSPTRPTHCARKAPRSTPEPLRAQRAQSCCHLGGAENAGDVGL
jgi:hypothetical protein